MKSESWGKSPEPNEKIEVVEQPVAESRRDNVDISVVIRAVITKNIEEGLRKPDKSVDGIEFANTNVERDICGDLKFATEENSYEKVTQTESGPAWVKMMKKDGVYTNVFEKTITKIRSLPESNEEANSNVFHMREIIAAKDEPSTETYHFGAMVFLENEESRLCLNELLPKDCLLSPNGVLKLSEYLGNDASNGEFLYAPITGKRTQSIVEYGNISTNEGILSLLHEIAHAWQQRFHKEGIENSDIVNKLVLQSIEKKRYDSALNTPLTEYGRNIVEEIKSQQDLTDDAAAFEFIERERTAIEMWLSEYGVTFEKGEVVILKENPMYEKVKDYVWTERQAWSLALKIFREMKSHNLVPESGSEDGLREKIHESLVTYESCLKVLNMDKEHKFTRKPLK